MSTRAKRKATWDPNESDPEDGDYGAPSPPRPARRPKKPSSSSSRPKKKRRYADSDGEIEEDDDDDSLLEDSYGDPDESEEEAETNERTGRAVRKVTKRDVKYEEPSESDEDLEESVESSDGEKKKRTAKKKSLVVKLLLPPQTMDGLNRQSSRQGSAVTRGSSEAPKSGRMTRRSTRLSEDPQAGELVELTNSGNHAQVVRPGTRSPSAGASAPRRTRGSKGLKQPPSAIMEASQETPSKEVLETSERDVDAGEEDQEETGTAGQGVSADPKDDDAESGENIILDSDHDPAGDDGEDDDDDDDDAPVSRNRRSLRSGPEQGKNRPTRQSQRSKKGVEESSDFEPTVEDEDDREDDAMSDSDRKRKDDSESTNTGRRSGRLRNRGSQRSPAESDHEDDIDHDELAAEADELNEDRIRRRTRRARAREIQYDEQPALRNRSNRPDYRIFRPELQAQWNKEDEELQATTTPNRNRRGGGGGGAAYRSLFSLAGPFGGAGGPPAVFGGPEAAGAVGGADSDSSDDEGLRRRPTLGTMGGAVGMTPTSAAAPNMFPQPLNSDPLQGGVGKVKDKKALADADPLGVDPNVNFEGVGGLDNHINSLKEMVALPLLYPEVFQKFNVTPPRGVLFHGPPGTGKTLLARALASSISQNGKKVTFYMRKGADALSKWVGEAERQLRLLFEEARKNQPSIIFFDEIDGLAPVRSSKQEQIHASIVATLLALMDGMDGRGQVVVIGATNRPDNIDPALRRPGRFDREFYFPLPDQQGRRAILDIHTKGWSPPLEDRFKNELASITKGYGGADLRSLCTEAMLNAIQGTFPQIYQSDKKLVIDTGKINVVAKDFMLAFHKIVPSSERAATSTSVPLTKTVEPLLRTQLESIVRLVEEMIPQQKKLTALEEAMFDDRDDPLGFQKATMQRDFEQSRVYRPRLLIHGTEGMGQQYLGSALLARLETLHVQAFDLPTMFEDSARSSDATLISLFKEVRRHKPSVIYIPNVDMWYNTVGEQVVQTFSTMLRQLPSNDPVIVIGVMETEKPLAELEEDKDLWPHYEGMMRDLFSYSSKARYEVVRPDEPARREYFGGLISHVRKRPMEFPDPENRKKRRLEELPVAEEAKQASEPSKEELKAQKKSDRMTLNLLKIHIQPIMDQIRTKHRKFRTPIVDDSQLGYLYDEQNPAILATDLTEEQRTEQQMYRPYEIATDKHGVQGLRETATGKFFYNLDTVMIEKRLSNGYYKRPRDFLADIKRIAKDSRTSGDADRTIKANEMLANVEVDIQTLLDAGQPALVAECEGVYAREQAREKRMIEKARAAAAAAGEQIPTIRSNVPPQVSTTTADTGSGPVELGEPVPGSHFLQPVTPQRSLPSDLTNGDTGPANGQHAVQNNGSTVHSRRDAAGDGDVVMVDSQDAQVGRTDRQPSATSPVGPVVQQRSQRSALEKMPYGSQLADFHNSASTTSSGQKSSDRSNRISDRSNDGPDSNNTQGTNGTVDPIEYDFSALRPTADSGGSQLADTQDYPDSQNSQPAHGFTLPPMPSTSRQPNATPSLLNIIEPRHALDEQMLSHFHDELATKTSGCSVEQLEQLHAALMDTIWHTKRDGDRNRVIWALKASYEATMNDIEKMQLVLQPSQRLLRQSGGGTEWRV